MRCRMSLCLIIVLLCILNPFPLCFGAEGEAMAAGENDREEGFIVLSEERTDVLTGLDFLKNAGKYYSSDEMVSRVNYYGPDGKLIYYESIAYYDNGLFCSLTLFTVDYYTDGTPFVGTDYTVTILYDADGNLQSILLDRMYMKEWINTYTGEVTLDLILDYEPGYDPNGYNKVVIYPLRESINQEKYGVDPSKTENEYLSPATIPFKTSGTWVSAYLRDVLEKEYTDSISCRLIYINEDTIPEFWIDYGYGYAGAKIYTEQNGVTDSIYFSHGRGYWNSSDNRILISQGHQGAYNDDIYAIENGKFVLLSGGEKVLPYNEFTWNTIHMSESEYEDNLARWIDREHTEDIYQNVYSYEQMKSMLMSINDHSY